MHDISLTQIFVIIPTTVSCYLTWAMTILCDSLRQMQDARVKWPQGEEFEENNALVVVQHPLLDGAFGSLDGLNLMVQTSTDQELKNATFNGWLHEHFVSSVFAFNAKGEIIACKLNAPGSWHDSCVAKPIYEKLRTQTPEGFYLWGNRGIQGSFGCLHVPLPIRYHETRGDLLEVCVHLFNYHTRTIGYNQIRSVYMPIWQEGGQEEIWQSFENILFSDQRNNDRVARFYNIVSHE
ncbi:uncharacterized protein BT62DRAFT_982658 [Guyanagaster necrorhizus]|uniref:DDE Tnp4 domain-containing protein n=1 Tax=Guyanagaster necrorhizus TaxID=856835 RepID=A0A9P8ANE0_9AGAR|nr:uncharacterized protein BT62DRAFT_982658 [Guyanagaster necrorhizus MCA 3950]KAG7441800.1 hypothetical protein BT62DRAFT_982658 [Guyanagaster necrorhizus MCA 3950]